MKKPDFLRKIIYFSCHLRYNSGLSTNVRVARNYIASTFVLDCDLRFFICKTFYKQ
jgi:hypothetical protein